MRARREADEKGNLMKRFHVGLMLTAVCLVSSLTAPVRADSLRDNEAKFASGAGAVAFVAAGVLLPLREKTPEGKQQAARTADALLTGVLLSESLKRIVHADRPDGSGDDSFPSTHATAAFAVAAMQSHYHRKQAPLWYLGAAVIAESRVQQDKHRWQDVVAGGLLGYATAHYERKSQRGLLLTPFIGQRSGGVAVAGKF